MIRSILILSSIMMASACDDVGDPDTTARDELSPPLGLTTVTGNEQIELRWDAQNFESELQGYNVFMISNKSIEEIAADSTILPQYPELASGYASANVLRQASIPRCSSNNDFFTAFGITQTTDVSCTDSSSIFLNSPTINLQDTNEEQAAFSSAKQACFDPDNESSELGNTNLSLAKGSGSFQDGNGTQRCLIKGLTNGTNYTFIVVAVLGDDFDQISWTSNLADDTPAPSLYNQSVTLTSDFFRTVTIAENNGSLTATVSDEASCPTGTGSQCLITTTNTQTSNNNSIYISRDLSSSYPQRVLVSTETAGNIQILERGPLTYDQDTQTNTSSIPGDMAADSSSAPYLDKGFIFPVYEQTVIDFVYTPSGSSSNYYGKLVFGDYSYANDSNEGVLTVPVTVIAQPTAGNRNYFH